MSIGNPTYQRRALQISGGVASQTALPRHGLTATSLTGSDCFRALQSLTGQT